MEISSRRPATEAGPAEWFTGAVWIDTVADAAPPGTVQVRSVHFAPGARTAWHTHPRGQILHVTEGAGRVSRRGGPVREIRAGDTVRAEPGEWHWHGAGPDTFLTHLAIQEADERGVRTEWGAHVTDSEYTD